MFCLGIGDYCFRIENKYDYIRSLCDGYILPPDTAADCEVSVSDGEIAAEHGEGEGTFPPSYLESLAVYRKIAEFVSGREGLLMHGVLMEVRGAGILLCARSGVGKTTHSRLWQTVLGDECRIINGDKPIVRRMADGFFGYGTPWCGKEHVSENRRVPLRAIAFVERSEKNETVSVRADGCIQRIFNQTYFSPDPLLRLAAVECCSSLLSRVPTFLIRCNMDPEAARVASGVILPAILH